MLIKCSERDFICYMPLKWLYYMMSNNENISSIGMNLLL